MDLMHKSQYAPVPYPTMQHSEQKCTHFCSEWCIVGYGTGAFWDFFSIFKSPLSAVLGQTSYIGPKCIRLTSLYRQLLLVLISADIVLPMIYMCANNMLQCNPAIILWLCPANERWRYIVTSSLIGWAHTQNDPCNLMVVGQWQTGCI